MSDERDSQRLEKILGSVQNPSTYLGCEPNAISKDYSKISGSIALAFPDLYEIGMSHFGLKILYSIINDIDGLAAERLFAPKEDMADALAKEGAPLFSLESKRPVRDFDVVGFTIPYELSYTTILWMLDLSKIPLLTEERTQRDPFVIGGGAGVFNPEPIAPFFDLFVLGDGERLTPLILREIVSSREEKRESVLAKLAKIPGLYVPSMYETRYAPNGRIKKMSTKHNGGKWPARVFLNTLDESPFPYKMVVPFHATQNRLTVEIDRGCTQGCRFCQAGITYRPARERSPEKINAIIDKALKETGYDSVSMMSLSAGDYSMIEPLLTMVMDRYSDDRVSMSLPSLRPATVTEHMINEIGRVRKSGFTISSEAGNARLRNVINKKVTDEDIENVAVSLLKHGWRSLKLYFMLGLPTETDEDVISIYTLSDRLSKLSVDGKKFMNINVSASNFVPKAHTPFQWFGQDNIESLSRKKELLHALIKKNKRLKLKRHDPKMSHLEAVFSKGDRRLADVIVSAYKSGLRLDAWSERFDFDRWSKAFAVNDIDPAFYANRDMALDEILPWDHIDVGVTKKFLLKEWRLAREGKMTGDCKTGHCLACGLDPKGCFEKYDPPTITKKQAKQKIGNAGRQKYRLIYGKRGLSRFLSHLETKALIERAIRTLNAPVAYSEGFSPHPLLSYSGALGVGIESRAETLDVTMGGKIDGAKFITGLNGHMPAGIRFNAITALEPGARSIGHVILGYNYEIRLYDSVSGKTAEDRVAWFNGEKSLVISKGGSSGKTVDLKKVVNEMRIETDPFTIKFRLMFGAGGSARPAQVYKTLFAGSSAVSAKIIKRSNIIRHG